MYPYPSPTDYVPASFPPYAGSPLFIPAAAHRTFYFSKRTLFTCNNSETQPFLSRKGFARHLNVHRSGLNIPGTASIGITNKKSWKCFWSLSRKNFSDSLKIKWGQSMHKARNFSCTIANQRLLVNSTERYSLTKTTVGQKWYQSAALHLCLATKIFYIYLEGQHPALCYMADSKNNPFFRS